MSALVDFVANNSTLIGLIGFFLAFVLIAAITYRPANKARIESYGHIPFKERE
ncbi:MAG: cbb3-type cytochrome c oxidase subunit 3 [Alphaproteobacteria bacterium]|jgi:cbb3-type cytochrome oxidase subunit 3|nr:cbb3-type cytochrome c oxidase subunit 3 [Alphaproteobacteria bacterium]